MYRTTLLSISTIVFCLCLSSFAQAIPTPLSRPNPSMIAAQTSSDRSAQRQVDRVQVVQQFIEAVEARDVRAINELLADNVVLEQPFSPLQPGGIRVEGKQAANIFFDRIFRQYSQIRFVDVVFRQSQFDNAVILEGRGDFRIAADQSPYRNQYVGVVEVVDDRITLVREYFNPLIVPGGSNVQPGQEAL